ncbi:unnamed protein product, partial [Trypanosoma congolense IL3000]
MANKRGVSSRVGRGRVEAASRTRRGPISPPNEATPTTETDSELVAEPMDQCATSSTPDTTVDTAGPLSDSQPDNVHLRDELIWSDGDDDNDVILFPDAEELVRPPDTAASSSVIRLGLTQKLEESDSSEDEATLNRVGDIPLEWYKDEAHYGYDVEGRKLMKSERSALERLLGATDDPNAME